VSNSFNAIHVIREEWRYFCFIGFYVLTHVQVAMRTEIARLKCALAWLDRDLVRSDSSVSTDVISRSQSDHRARPDRPNYSLFDHLGARKTAQGSRSASGLGWVKTPRCLMATEEALMFAQADS
jgi:hypothetical protein